MYLLVNKSQSVLGLHDPTLEEMVTFTFKHRNLRTFKILESYIGNLLKFCDILFLGLAKNHFLLRKKFFKAIILFELAVEMQSCM